MPSTLILKPCHRTAATMQAKTESSSLGSGRPKWMSKSRVSTTSIRAYSLAFSFVAQCSMWWRMTAGQETPINLSCLAFLSHLWTSHFGPVLIDKAVGAYPSSLGRYFFSSSTSSKWGRGSCFKAYSARYFKPPAA